MPRAAYIRERLYEDKKKAAAQLEDRNKGVEEDISLLLDRKREDEAAAAFRSSLAAATAALFTYTHIYIYAELACASLVARGINLRCSKRSGERKKKCTITTRQRAA